MENCPQFPPLRLKLKKKYEITTSSPAVATVPYAPPQPASWLDWSFKNIYSENTSVRNNLCLNNYWQFVPVPASALERVIAAKGELPPLPAAMPGFDLPPFYIKVPGRWDARGGYTLYDAGKKAVESIRNIGRSDYTQGFYRRTLWVPESWKNQKILLDFEGVNERATVFVNGRKAGAFTKTGTMDITSLVRFGAENDLSILVSIHSLPVRPDSERFRDFVTQRLGTNWWYNWRPGPGITGDVWLRTAPARLAVGEIFVIPAVEKQLLSVRTSVGNHWDRKQQFLVSASVWDGDRQVLAIPPQDMSLGVRENKEIALAANWENPVCWSPENPQLYTLNVKITDSAGNVLDENAVRFGYREFRVANGNFLLNGRPIRLKFDSSQCNYDKMTETELRNAFSEYKKMNFNGFIIESVDKRIFRLADEMGMMIAMRHVMPPLVREGTYLPGVPNHGYPAGIYFSRKLGKARQEFEGIVSGIVKQFRNHPSLIIWAINPLLCYNSEWINPNRLDAERVANDVVLASFKVEAFIRSLDPTRTVLHSMGANTGSIIAANPYPTFSNQPDEWCDWPSVWASRKKKPLLMEEIAVPFCFDFANWYKASANRGSEWGEMYQMFHENAARYFGDAAYRDCRDDMQDKLWHQRANVILTAPDGGKHADMNRAAEAVESLWAERCFRAWRMYGVNGMWPFFGLSGYFSDAVTAYRKQPEGDVCKPGLRPDFAREADFRYPNRLARTMQSVFNPFLAFIGGRESHFTSREHLWFSGEKIEKTMLFSNDSPRPLPIRGEWRAVIVNSGRTVASGKWAGTLKAGTSLRVPFSLNAPAVREKTACRLFFTAQAGEVRQADVFDFTVFPAHQPVNLPAIVLYDENKATSAMLRKAGVPLSTTLTGAELDRVGILGIGRDSFTAAFAAWAKRVDLERRIQDGLTVIVFSQGEQSAIAGKLEERRARAVFAKDPSHPILKGLSNSDLSYWRGASTAVTPYPDPAAAVRNQRFMRWGTEGSVATYVLDKPFAGKFRVILDADFDQSRAVLLEWFAGKGRILFCQLDLEERYGCDPAATRLTEQLLQYAGAPAAAPQERRLATDSPRMAAWLRRLGFNPGEITPSQAADFIRSGGIVVREQAAETGKTVRLGKLPPEDELGRGLGASDVYFNPALPLPKQPFQFKSTGRGVELFCPNLPQKGVSAYAQAKLNRVLAVLLFNAGAVAATDTALLPRQEVRVQLPRKVPFRIDPQNKGEASRWHRPDFPDADWRKIELGVPWEGQGVTDANVYMKSAAAYPYDGYAWYRITFEIPESLKGTPLYFEADAIDDLDVTWFNGVKIGRTGEETPNYYQAKRKYPIPADAIRWGRKNTIAIRVLDLRGEGGILGDLRVSDGTAPKMDSILYVNSPRNLHDFDPNAWRQW